MLDYKNQQVYKWQTDEAYNEMDQNISMTEESRDNSPEREVTTWQPTRGVENRPNRTIQIENTILPQRREERSPIRQNQRQNHSQNYRERELSEDRRPQIPYTPRIPRHRNRFSPLIFTRQGIGQIRSIYRFTKMYTEN